MLFYHNLLFLPRCSCRSRGWKKCERERTLSTSVSLSLCFPFFHSSQSVCWCTVCVFVCSVFAASLLFVKFFQPTGKLEYFLIKTSHAYKISTKIVWGRPGDRAPPRPCECGCACWGYGLFRGKTVGDSTFLPNLLQLPSRPPFGPRGQLISFLV